MNLMVGNKDIKVSIIIPTYNREEVLCQTLDLVLRQSCSSYEVIVVDQTKKHLPSTEGYIEQIKHSIRYFKLDRPNLPAARNLGVEKAQGEIVVFLDDDVSFDVHLLESHLLNYSNPEVGGVAGRVITPGEPVVRTEKVGYFSRLGICHSNFSSDRRTWVHSAMGCNMSFRTRLIFEAGLFDPDFIGNCHREESDFCFRLRGLGYGIIFDPRASVIHLVAPQGGSRSEDPSDERSATFFHNETLFYLKNVPQRFWFLALPAQYRHYVLRKANLSNGTFLTKTANFFQGIWLGMKTYKREKARSAKSELPGKVN